ncbi:MAG TPA: hypothetical protein VHV47_10110, partial [Opitutaceae bacterium]|nr:hypothetical protein [Opitutaceae bacterium]
FIDRFAIAEFSRALGYEILTLQDGDKPTVPIEETIRWENGAEMKGMGNLGQSICVLKKS